MLPPGGECLRDVAARVLAFYLQQILPAVMREQATLVVAHGNSLRALVMVLDELSPEAVSHLEIATGEVLVYELASDTTVSGKRMITVDDSIKTPADASNEADPKPPADP